jgi:hypothetical protein
MPSKLIIKSHHPWKHRAKITMAVLGLVLVAWWVFDYGHSTAGFDYDNLLVERDALNDKLDTAYGDIKTLRERIAVLERAGQIDKQGYGGVERSLKQAQDEMLELKEEVAFYRGIVSPTETASGLSIADFQVSGIGEERAYRFKLVMTQMKSNTRVVKGYARVAFEGVQNGAQVEHTLHKVSGGALDKLRLRFKYFQNIEGEIVLPEGFLPSRVVIDVVPSGKGLTRLKKTFDWPDILG